MAKYLFLAPEVPLPFSPLSPEAFEEIKSFAGKAWKQHRQTDKDCPSTYRGAYGNKGLDAAASCRAAPSSPTRIHKPHPSPVFLVNQLHYIPGHYGNAKRTAGADSGYLEASRNFPYRLVESQLHPQQINHNAVTIVSPVTPLEAIQRWKRPASGNRTAVETEIILSNNQDIPTRSSESEGSDSVLSQL